MKTYHADDEPLLILGAERRPVKDTGPMPLVLCWAVLALLFAAYALFGVVTGEPVQELESTDRDMPVEIETTNRRH